MHFFKSQRGAMFGLDARIAMAIIGALSLVGGATMFTTSSEVKAKALIKDFEAYKAAVEGMQYDIKRDIYTSVVTGVEHAALRAFASLNDVTMLEPAYRTHWLGPYLKGRQDDITMHENYGQLWLHKGSATDPGAASGCGALCFYWIKVEDVPEKDFMVINDQIDGVGEANPDTSGQVLWRPDNGTNPERIFYKVGKTL